MSVGAKGAAPLKLFVSYSHMDESWRHELTKHLKQLVRDEVLIVWHDRKLLPSEDWESAIDEHLSAADIVLLVSADFIHSDYAYGREMHKAVEQHHAGQTRVVPVILRHCDWNSKKSPLAGIAT